MPPICLKEFDPQVQQEMREPTAVLKEPRGFPRSDWKGIHVRYLVCVLVIALTAIAIAACICNNPKRITTVKASVPIEPPVDNSRCHVCHLNYQEEKLAARHAQVGVGCEKCHGTSDDHCGDEDNVTAPDTMYSLEKTNPFCLLCHQNLSSLHKSIVAGTFDRKYCTDCHGDHRLARRSRTWDKTTGKLIVGGQAITAPPKDTSGNPAIE